jgi:alanyl aminopeptidase
MWRAELLSFLGRLAEDPAVRRELARRGRAYLGLGRDGQIHPDAVAPDLAVVAILLAVQDGDAEVFDHALTRFRESTDPVVRSNLLRGLSGARDPERSQRVLALALDEDLRVNEIYKPLMIQLEEPTTRDGAFTWITEHYDALVERMGPGYAGYLPYAGASFCDAERASDVRAFFEPRVGATQGGPRNLAAAVESVSLCAARRAHARESAAAFFAD